ncbi:unnamed protein product, partial [Arabidopsis halleri]
VCIHFAFLSCFQVIWSCWRSNWKKRAGVSRVYSTTRSSAFCSTYSIMWSSESSHHLLGSLDHTTRPCGRVTSASIFPIHSTRSLDHTTR